MTQDFAPRFGGVVNDPDRDSFCGPAAISVVTGLPVAEVERQVIAARNYRKREGDVWVTLNLRRKDFERVDGMAPREIVAVLNTNGIITVDVDVPMVDSECSGIKAKRAPTFARWLKMTKHIRGDDVYMILTTSHVHLIRGNYFVDNNTNVPRTLDTHKRYRRSRVHSVYGLLTEAAA